MQGRAANQPAPLTGQDTGWALGYGCQDVPITETHVRQPTGREMQDGAGTSSLTLV